MGCWNGPVSEVRVLGGTGTLSTLTPRLLPSLWMLFPYSETWMELTPTLPTAQCSHDQMRSMQRFWVMKIPGKWRQASSKYPECSPVTSKYLLEQIAMFPLHVGNLYFHFVEQEMLVGSNPVLLSLQGTRHRAELYHRASTWLTCWNSSPNIPTRDILFP